jgi:hypothetical protein
MNSDRRAGGVVIGTVRNTPADHRPRQPGIFRPALLGKIQAALTARRVAVAILDALQATGYRISRAPPASPHHTP